jgi:hypothetical protein
MGNVASFHFHKQKPREIPSQWTPPGNSSDERIDLTIPHTRNKMDRSLMEIRHQWDGGDNVTVFDLRGVPGGKLFRYKIPEARYKNRKDRNMRERTSDETSRKVMRNFFQDRQKLLSFTRRF